MVCLCVRDGVGVRGERLVISDFEDRGLDVSTVKIVFVVNL